MTKTYYLFRIRPFFSCCLLFFIFYYVAPAQNHLISGQITDGQAPISGASIIIKHTIKGTVSDFDGHYELDAQTTDTLQISYLGYKTLELVVGNQRTIDVVLQEDATALGEVVINAGYYTVKERERTGSIAKVDAQVIEEQPVNTALEALQGRVAGLDITQTTGLAGGGYTVRIRGQNSITAGNEPLYVIDGVPYDLGSLSNQNLSGLVLPGGIINPLNTLDPNSIASIEVLKDADATAIYGSRGSNGVILITTKKGKQGKTKISLDVSTGLVTVTKMSELLNSEQYLAMREEAFANDGITNYPSYAYDINGTWDRNRYTDWQKEFVGNEGYNQTVRAAISGGNDQTRFAIGGSFMEETTVFPMDFNYKKYTVYTTLSHQSNDERLKLQFTTNYGLDKNCLPTSDLIRVAKYLPPNAPEIYDDEGNLNWENSTWNNPFAALASTYTNELSNLLANATLSYSFIKRLDLKVNLGYTRSNMDELQLNPHTIYNPAYGLTSSSSNAEKNEAERTSWIIEPQLDFSQDIAQGTVRLTIGGTMQEQMMEEFGLLGSGFVNNQQMNNLSSAENLRTTVDYNSQYRYAALFARINYNWKQKYIVNLTGRRDGSSRFGSGNQFANFGAIGLAWILTEENFLKNKKWINFAKIRTSYGTAGNDQIGDYQYLSTYTIEPVSYDGQIGLTPTSLFNANFGWERIKKFEIAMNVSLWRDHLNFEVAYYHNRSDNQLLAIPLPTTTGFSSLNSNFDATVDNYGWEVGVQTINLQSQDFEWRSGLQLSIPKNKLVAFKGLENSTYRNQLVIGEPLSIYKLYHLEGINTETGLYEFTDYNQDGEITAIEDRQVIGDLSPKFYGGLSNSLTYKNWNLDFLLQFTKKDGLNEFYNTEPPGFMQNQSISVLDHWQFNGNQGYVQAYTAGNNFEAYYSHIKFTQSQAIISDASFIRLKSFSLSYKLPLKKESSTTCTLSLQGQNVLTFTNFKGGDPEQLSSFLPPLKKYSIRVFLEL
ncbi:MAG: SusC/RagA family protein [Xanthomarina sp.]|uniref:SusC/RagA family TonB-linked outer membrane protein n=1 Tax=Xanthomarina gelatinilytica TaxID=1137281 RepID=A0A3C0F4D7_9FLAO|nr:SusC/RagA family protein [Xanthomarina sp.]MBF61522.1 SusC/RagA family protein [Xanthomarina sp.]HAI18421.1 SusC/RagA family TonB-linked outer membrane protein [Xanthomarina gelatinilytica]HCY80935.1 SusC/RagA family TonB-linked outer membrane protein [Xanthomarina gelatinilytica]